MKNIYKLFGAMLISTYAIAQPIPELMYYKFNSGTTIPNEASNPVGSVNATINGTGLSVGSTGLTGTALVGSGTSSSTDFVNTGWATNFSGSWTIGFHSENITPSTSLWYIFGDNTAGSMRCFTNGVAGANNWILRGTGMPDILATGGAVTAPKYIHFVYDATAAQMRSYVDGVLSNTAVVSAPFTFVGTAFRVGGYSTNSNLSGRMDEFRIYNRALTPAEIQATWNISLGGCSAPDSIAIGTPNCDGADISWVSDSGVLGSIIEYGPVGFTPGNGTFVSAGSSPFTLTGLAPQQSYHIYVRDSCAAGLSQPVGPNALITRPLPTADFSFQLFQTTFTFAQYNFNGAPSVNANAYTWYFGDGNSDTGITVSHQYTQVGLYQMTLAAHNDCGTDSLSININVQNVSVDEVGFNKTVIYPNPANDVLYFTGLLPEAFTCKITDASGRTMFIEDVKELTDTHSVSIQHLAPGLYFIEIQYNKGVVRKAIVVQ